MSRFPVLAFLLVLLLAPAAQAQTVAPDAPLDAVVGLWEVEIFDTPIGLVTGVLVVHPDGTGALSLVEMAVDDAPVVGLRIVDGALLGDVPEMFSTAAGRHFTCTLRFTRTDTGALDGVIDADGVAYRMTARRPAE